MYAFSTRRLALVSGLALALGIMGAATVHADELDDITKAGVIKVGIFEDFPPFSSAGTDLKSQGYDIDVINALAKALNVTPELTGITGQNRIPSLTPTLTSRLSLCSVSDGMRFCPVMPVSSGVTLRAFARALITSIS